MRALGLDVGSKTIGVALSDPGGVIASAREVWRRQGTEADVGRVAALVGEAEVDVVIVGLPLELDGTEGPRARRVLGFIAALTPALDGVPVHPWDERFSTAAAERTLLEADVSRRQRKAKIDALAAQHILQGWLDGRPQAGAS